MVEKSSSKTSLSEASDNTISTSNNELQVQKSAKSHQFNKKNNKNKLNFRNRLKPQLSASNFKTPDSTTLPKLTEQSVVKVEDLDENKLMKLLARDSVESDILAMKKNEIDEHKFLTPLAPESSRPTFKKKKSVPLSGKGDSPLKLIATRCLSDESCGLATSIFTKPPAAQISHKPKHVRVLSDDSTGIFQKANKQPRQLFGRALSDDSEMQSLESIMGGKSATSSTSNLRGTFRSSMRSSIRQGSTRRSSEYFTPMRGRSLADDESGVSSMRAINQERKKHLLNAPQKRPEKKNIVSRLWDTMHKLSFSLSIRNNLESKKSSMRSNSKIMDPRLSDMSSFNPRLSDFSSFNVAYGKRSKEIEPSNKT
eukprot:UN23830